MYNPRNPYTPKQGEVFTPVEYLQRTLSFYKWEHANKVLHLSTCELESREELRANGMCCLNYLKSVIDERLLNLAGCRTGIWKEPAGFQAWLSFAWKRLEELEEGHDFSDIWTKTFKDQGDEIHAWVRELLARGGDFPGFSTLSFKRTCELYDFHPNQDLVL